MAYQVTATIVTPKDIGLPVEIIQQVVKAETAKSQKSLLKMMQKYPAKPSGSTYQRTGRLRRSWRLEAVKDTVASRGVPYARYVQADNDQASVHEGRWTTEKQAVEREKKTYTSNIRRGIGRVRSGRGGLGASVKKVRVIFEAA